MNQEQINNETLARFKLATGRNARTHKEATAYFQRQCDSVRIPYSSRRRESRAPRFGSQEWAETRGDDLGLSPDC